MSAFDSIALAPGDRFVFTLRSGLGRRAAVFHGLTNDGAGIILAVDAATGLPISVVLKDEVVWATKLPTPEQAAAFDEADEAAD